MDGPLKEGETMRDLSKLYNETASILGVPADDVRDYCIMGDDNALLVVTPQELACEMREGGY